MIIKILNIIDEDFSNYEKASMFIAFPYCTFKCGKENCQNVGLAGSKVIEIDSKKIVKRYLDNPITEAIIFSGLEPFDSVEIFDLIDDFREKCDDTIVIYTGYTEKEVIDKGYLDILEAYKNIIVKYGRYVPGESRHFDSVLGVELASLNQYAVRVS